MNGFVGGRVTEVPLITSFFNLDNECTNEVSLR